MEHRCAIGAALIAPALLLAACDSHSASSGPGGVSEGEARALEDAADMLDERRLPEGALPDNAAANDGAEIDAAPQQPVNEDGAGE